ncbi:MAG: c-type cytochrome, partial [Myxococcales bacterium]|nr:c-type cytochrome [Myxococcales bacterium]
DPVTYDNLGKAIGAFERRLTTPAPIDAWLAGEDNAISHEAAEGMALFFELGCETCHNGYNFGGQSYQKLGTEKPWPGLTDVGRFKISNDERDRFAFKVPTLRNVDKTGPYLHDGSIDSLETMVNKMAEHQTKRGAALSAEEMAKMTAFLGSLTGELPGDYIKKPELPADGEAAPADGGDDDAADGGDEAKPDKPAKPAKEDAPGDDGE